MIAAFRDGERARLAVRDLEAMRIPGIRVRVHGPADLWAGGQVQAQLPLELYATGGDWSWAGVERQWLNHVLLLAEEVPERALNEVVRTLRQDGAERVTVGGEEQYNPRS